MPVVARLLEIAIASKLGSYRVNQVRGVAVLVLDDAFAAFRSTYRKSTAHKKGPPFGEPFSLLRMVPAPGVEPGTY